MQRFLWFSFWLQTGSPKHLWIFMKFWDRRGLGMVNNQLDFGGVMRTFTFKKWRKQGVALTKRKTTGPPSRAAHWWVTLHMRQCYRRWWQTTDEDNRWRRQTPATVTSPPPYTMCRRASNNAVQLCAYDAIYWHLLSGATIFCQCI